jgi:pimeloyl-ACP methyl ester carboxylesterase
MSPTSRDRPVLFLLPGLLCDRASWDDVASRLAPGVECRVPDYSSEHSLGAMAERVLAEAPATFALAGHSMGGRVALEVLRRAPGRVTRIALLDTGYRSRPDGSAGESERQKRLALLALARDKGMRAMGREWMRAMVHPARLADAPLVESILEMIERQTPDRYAAQVEALLDRPDVSDLLGGIAVPSLVACGREDGWAPPEQHAQIAARIPGSRLALFDDCGHMAPMERPDAVARELAAWLRAAAPADADRMEAN